MKRAGIVLHGAKQSAAECGLWLADLLRSNGVEVFSLAADVPRMKEVVEPATEEQFRRGFDLIFALGGDGTFLRAAELAADSGTPLLGVNLGRVGFLTTIERDDLPKALEKILRDGFNVAQRMTLDADIVVDGVVRTSMWALNDVSVTKLEPGRLIKLGISIGGEPLTTLAADGVVVATPTGSTAYSFSSGGPIVKPSVDCIIVTPISPHLVFDRSVVAAPDDMVEIQVLPDPDAVAASADGHPYVEVPPGGVVRIRRSSRDMKLASVDDVPFWRLVRTKFGLPEPR